MSMSPRSSIPVIAVTRTGPGWLVACHTPDCDFERFTPGGRASADRIRHEHMQAHAKKKGG